MNTETCKSIVVIDGVGRVTFHHVNNPDADIEEMLSKHYDLSTITWSCVTHINKKGVDLE